VRTGNGLSGRKNNVENLEKSAVNRQQTVFYGTRTSKHQNILDDDFGQRAAKLDGKREKTGRRRQGERLIAVYGAGMVGVSVYYAVKTLYEDWNIIHFIVSEKAGNPTEIDGIPVIALQEVDRTDIRILVAVPEDCHNEVIAELEKMGLMDYVCIDSRTEARLMEHFYNRIGRFPTLRSYKPGTEKPSIKVYMARSHKDRVLDDPYKLAEWICPIQAGAALTEVQIEELRDDTGENISKKNGNYSELSAMYWIGKHGGNEGHSYLGLFHYRRMLDITEKDLYRMEKNKIDVILPYPTIHYPSIRRHHRRYVEEGDWESMLQALKELAPEYAESMPEIFSQPYFYNYNMVVVRSNILKEYCGWLFPILSRTEELSNPRGWERQDRYIGYLGENLTTLYFMYHRNDFKTAHTGRMMLV